MSDGGSVYTSGRTEPHLEVNMEHTRNTHRFDRVHVFERPLAPGWIHPCSIADIEERLRQLPVQDLDGLWAVGLVPSTRKDCDADARYNFCRRPEIHIFSQPATMRFKLRAHTRFCDIERALAVNMRYGMKIHQVGSRYVCEWTADTLRSFILDHVLLHEFGHHVFFSSRMKQGYPYTQHVAGTEQFAEDYAIRYNRQNRPQR